MSYFQDLAINFVDGSVSRQIYYTFQVLDKFISKIGPEIEGVYAEYISFINQPFINIGRKEIENYIRGDSEEARKALQWYNVVMNSIENQLALLTSKFGLFDFLKENKISLEYLPDVNAEISKYWSSTYGPLIRNIEEISIYLKRLYLLLEEQLKILETLPKASYYLGFELEPKLKNLFEEERETFWRLASVVENSRKDNTKLEAIFKSHVKKVKEMIKAHLKILSREAVVLKQDFRESETNLRKALVVLAYLTGAILLYMNLKSSLIQKGIKGALNKIKYEKKKVNSFKVGKK